MQKRFVPGGGMVVLGLLDALDWFGRGQSLSDLATGAPEVIARLLLFLLSDVGTVSLIIGGFASLLVAVVYPPPPVALTRGGNRKAKQSWRTTHPLRMPAAVAMGVLCLGLAVETVRVPYPPIQIAIVPEFDSPELFPIRFRVRNGPVALHDVNYRCKPSPAMIFEGGTTVSGNIAFSTNVEIDGVRQPLRSRFQLAPNSSNVVLDCAYTGAFANKPVGGTTAVELELSIAGVSGRRKITRRFDLSKDNGGIPLWVEAKGGDQWVYTP